MFNKILQTLKKEKTKTQTSNQETEDLNNFLEDGVQFPFDKENFRKDFILDEDPVYKQVNLDKYKLECEIGTCFYLKNYLNEREQQDLVDQIYQVDRNKWVELKQAKRRLQKWGGDVTEKGIQNKEKIPEFFQKIIDKLHFYSEITKFQPNHILLNEYPKAQGIMPHTDGPLYYPFVCSISLQSDCLFKFYKNYDDFKQEKEQQNILCEKGSLLCFSDQLYNNFMHSILDYAIETILLEIKIKEENQEFSVEIVNSTINNLKLTHFYDKIQKSDKKQFQEFIQQEVLIPLKNNPQFNYIYEIKREKRISLTIRNVPDENQSTQNNQII